VIVDLGRSAGLPRLREPAEFHCMRKKPGKRWSTVKWRRNLPKIRPPSSQPWQLVGKPRVHWARVPQFRLVIKTGPVRTLTADEVCALGYGALASVHLGFSGCRRTPLSLLLFSFFSVDIIALREKKCGYARVLGTTARAGIDDPELRRLPRIMGVRARRCVR